MEDFEILDALDEVSDFSKTILPVLHPKVREFVKEICDEIKSPPQWVFFSVLNVLSALCGESQILFGDKHLERAVLFHIIMGPSSSRKSPLYNAIKKSLTEAQEAITKQLEEDAEQLILSVDKITKQELINTLIRNTQNRYILTMLAEEMLATFPFIQTEEFKKSQNSNDLDKDLLLKLSGGSDVSNFLVKNNGNLSKNQVPYTSMSLLGFVQPAVLLYSFSERDATGFWQRFDIIPGRRVFVDHERVAQGICRIVDMVRRDNTVGSLSVSSPIDPLDPETSRDCEATVENLTKKTNSGISRLSKLWTTTYAFTGQKRLFLVDGDTYVNVFMDYFKELEVEVCHDATIMGYQRSYDGKLIGKVGRYTMVYHLLYRFICASEYKVEQCEETKNITIIGEHEAKVSIEIAKYLRGIFLTMCDQKRKNTVGRSKASMKPDRSARIVQILLQDGDSVCLQQLAKSHRPGDIKKAEFESIIKELADKKLGVVEKVGKAVYFRKAKDICEEQKATLLELGCRIDGYTASLDKPSWSECQKAK